MPKVLYNSSFTSLYALVAIGMVATPNMVDCERLHRRMTNHDGSMQTRMLDRHLEQRLVLAINTPPLQSPTFDDFAKDVAKELHRRCPSAATRGR